MAERPVPKPGEFYRHFKGGLYQVLLIARDAGTEERIVVYQALYGEYGVWTRSLRQFLSEVDHERYPDVKQTYRFERTHPGIGMLPAEEKPAAGTRDAEEKSAAGTIGAGIPGSRVRRREPDDEDGPRETDPTLLLRFLDAESTEQKKIILLTGMGKLTQDDLDGIYTALGLSRFDGEIRDQVRGLISYLNLQDKYESDRLREGRQGVIRVRKRV